MTDITTVTPSTKPESKFKQFWRSFDIRGTIALVLLAAIVGLAFLRDLHGVAPADDVTKMIIIALVTNFTNIVGWYFGSSKSSQDKDTTISSIAAGQTPAITSETKQSTAEVPKVGT